MFERRQPFRGEGKAKFRLFVSLVCVVTALTPLLAHAHSDGIRCDEGIGPVLPLLLDGPLGDYVHCHDSGDMETDTYWYTGAVYAQVPGVAHGGICTDTDQPLPPGLRLSPFFGSGEPSPESMDAQGCDPASYIQVTDFQFDPAGVTLSQGSTVRWRNEGPSSHTSTYAGGLHVWDSLSLEPGEVFEWTLTQAGTYPYHCKNHPEIMTGRISIAIAIDPSSGTESTTFTITLATIRATSGVVYDVQMRTGSEEWAPYRYGVRSRSITFDPSSFGPGTYAFRSRVRKLGGTHPTTEWSPPKSITVS